MPEKGWATFSIQFQFNYCTIKSAGCNLLYSYTTSFQFNYCTIKSHESYDDELCSHVFQFNYCTIKRTLFIIFACLLKNFNSTIVRLKGGSAFSEVIYTSFQFNYCTIKSSRENIRHRSPHQISIQLLYD